MRRAIARIMALALLRDRGALALSFLLPGLVFVIFAIAFSGATGGSLTLRLAVADQRESATSRELVDSLFSDGTLVRVGGADVTPKEIVEIVRAGDADVGLVVRAGPTPLFSTLPGGAAPFRLVTDPSRAIATSLVAGAVQRALIASSGDDRPEQALVERTPAVPDSAGFSAVSYYAGGVAMLFLLLSSVTAALSLLEEHENGLLDRIASGPGGTGAVIDGKFAFLALRGFTQVAIVFFVAWLVFGVALTRPGAWATTTAAAAISASGLSLGFVASCRTRQQAETLGTMAALVLSALGGSMVPRFLMPPEIQSLGWGTPNAWALEAYASLAWHGGAASLPWTAWLVLTGSGALGWLVARTATARRR